MTPMMSRIFFRTVVCVTLGLLAASVLLRWSYIVGQFGSPVKVYSVV